MAAAAGRLRGEAMALRQMDSMLDVGSRIARFSRKWKTRGYAYWPEVESRSARSLVDV